MLKQFWNTWKEKKTWNNLKLAVYATWIRVTCYIRNGKKPEDVINE